MVTVLDSGSTQLMLSTDASRWCEMELAFDGRRLPIGADVEYIVIERLLRGLRDSLTGPSAGSIGGIEVVWILSLAERHTSVYASQYEGKRILFFQDADGNLLTRIELADTDRQRWIRELQAIRKLGGGDNE